MGTRNLTMVIQDKQVKVAQYGQWDGYPSVQGETILRFILKDGNIEKLEKQLSKCRFLTKLDIKKRENLLKRIGSVDGWINSEQGVLYDKQFPLDNRNIGADILNKIIRSKKKEIILRDSSDFAKDGLFCEWGYVIDLDNKALEVYEGFSTTRMKKGERFYSKEPTYQEYYPIKLKRKYKFGDLTRNTM